MRREAEGILAALMCRAIGHTHVMRTGTDNNDCIVIAHSAKYAREIAGAKGIALDQCSERLRGLRKPLAIDNLALQYLLSGLLDEQYDLAAALQDARNQLYEERHPTMSEMKFLASVSIIDAALKKAGITK